MVIRVDAVGICGSDMHAFHGRDPRRNPPLILGHELAGEIVDGPGKGSRVTVNPLITCGRCDYCLQGRNNLCANRTMIGMTRPGGFAEYVTTAAASLIELPQGMSTRAAALTEPAATALHALNLAMRAAVRPVQESDVLVIGARRGRAAGRPARSRATAAASSASPRRMRCAAPLRCRRADFRPTRPASPSGPAAGTASTS